MNQLASRRPLLFGRIRRSAGREALLGVLLATPWMIRLLVLHAYPIVAAFYFSFTRYVMGRPPEWIGLDNHAVMFFRDRLVMRALYNSIYYSVLAVPLQLSLGLFLAVLLVQNIRGLSVFRAVFFVPTIVPTVASAILWLWLLNPRVGLVNEALVRVGVPRIPWLSSPRWIKPAFILMSLWAVGWDVVLFVAGLQNIPRHLYEAAEIDGAGVWARFRNVTIPMLTPTIFFNLVMGIIASLQIFGPAFVMLRGPAGGPQNAALFYVLYIFRQGFQYFEMGYACALAVFMFIVVLAITMLVFKSSALWVYYEASK